MKKEKKVRYKLIFNKEVVFETSTIDGIAEYVGCTRAHIYKYINNGVFKFKKITYEIVDKLD